MSDLTVFRHLFYCAVLALGSLLPTSYSWSHGSVVDSGEGCVIRMDFYSAHFSIFQPQTRGHRQFCEDLPDVSESVFVLEYLHNSLREVPVDFRIIRNTSELGRFVRWQDIEALDNIELLTVFHQHVPPRPDGVLSVMHAFVERGNYVGIVTAPHPDQDTLYHAVFPFSVGRPLWQRADVLLLSLFAVLAAAFYTARKKRRPM